MAASRSETAVLRSLSASHQKHHELDHVSDRVQSVQGMSKAADFAIPAL